MKNLFSTRWRRPVPAAPLPVVLVLITGLIPLSGCMTAVKQVFYEFRGAKAKVHPLRDTEPAVFLPYQSLSFRPATTTAGERICPPKLLREFDQAGREASKETSHFEGGPPALTIDAEMLYYQEKGIFSAAECLTRIRMSDADRTVFECIVKSESKAITRGGADDLAQACAKAVGDFLDKQKRKALDQADDADKKVD